MNRERLVQKSLYEMLCRHGYKVAMSDSVEHCLKYLEENPARVVLFDLNEDGGELLSISKKKGYLTAFIVLTSYGDIESAVRGMKMGACDYLVRPVEDEKIISAIEKAQTALSSSIEESQSSRAPSGGAASYDLIGGSPQIKEMLSLVRRISNTKATVLLRGESGTGKRLIAHAIHRADKNRRERQFIEVSCGALPKEIVESELFGHTKGSFTGAISDRKGRFELADEGTILLDDIDSFSLDLQVKLLRVLQHKEFERVGDHKTIKVDVRVIASTNENLENAIAAGRFREDLYYRLNVISITVPPLRERKSDIPLLMEHFFERYSRDNYKKIKRITDEAQVILLNYHWPGNIRELENIIERAVILDTDNIIDKDDLPELLINSSSIQENKPGLILDKQFSSLKDALKEPERVYILKILEEVGWNKKRAAVKLGVDRTTLYNKLRRYNLLSYSKEK